MTAEQARRLSHTAFWEGYHQKALARIKEQATKGKREAIWAAETPLQNDCLEWIAAKLREAGFRASTTYNGVSIDW